MATFDEAISGFDLTAFRRARLVRRIGLIVLTALVIAGATGVLGVRTASVSAERDGYSLTVRYPRVTRGGLAVSWTAEVTKPGGFDAPVVVTTTMAYMDLFDYNTMDPEPSGERVRDDAIEWTFEPPVGDTLTITLDARVEPAVQSGDLGTTAVLVDGITVVSVAYRTTVLP